MENGISNTLVQIGHLYKQIQDSKTDSEFFHGLALFLKKFVEDPSYYEPFDKYWKKEKENDFKKLEEYEKKLQQEVEETKKIFENKIKQVDTSIYRKIII